jgi:MFS family permease
VNKLRPYLELLTNNANYRRLWLAQSISNFGDWFGLLAVYAIISRYSDSEFLLGLIIVVKMMSLAVFSPFAGYLTDRFNRRKLMIICDLLRAVFLLGILLVRSPDMLWAVYVFTALQMMLSAVFEPAKTSSIPNITTDKELVNANVLSTATWSIIFTTSMAIGGFVTEWYGTDVVIILDAFSYILSAWFIFKAVIPQTELSEAEKKRTRNPLTGIREGLVHLFSNQQILRPSLAKGTSTMFLGGLVYMLIVLSEEVLALGSIGIGLLYAARGLGTGIGPVLGRRLFRNEKDWVTVMGGAILTAGSMYVIVGSVESIVIMLIFVTLAHSASGANWVMSTVLLQKRTVDTFRGRIFSTEWLLFTIGNSISTIVASLVLEAGLLEIRQLIVVYGAVMALAGIVWSFTITRQEKVYQEEGKLELAA